MSADDTALLIVDVQGRLVTLVPEHERIVANIGRLIDGAKILGVPVQATEQYPKGLGPTTAALAERLDSFYSNSATPKITPTPKIAFSCGECAAIFADWTSRGIERVLVVGIETHVCIQQTVLDLMAFGLRVYVAVDAVGARGAIDHETALRRMESSGATLTTTESALFEWCQRAGSPQFKQISALVKSGAEARVTGFGGSSKC